MSILGRISDGLRAMFASWNHRGGYASPHRNDGSKFTGALGYPSLWGQDYEALRNRARQAYWDSTQARSLVGRLVDNVINTGLRLEASPVWDIIEPEAALDETTEQARRSRVRNIEARFNLWANSTESDATGRMTLYGLERFAFLNVLRDGEVILVLRYSGERGRMSPLNVQFINPDQVFTPYDRVGEELTKPAGTHRIVDGFEVDAAGREIAVYVHDADGKPTRVPVYGAASGRRFVLHPAVIDSVGQVRGVSPLAHIVHEIQKITDYTVAEIEAAVVNASIAAWVEPSDSAPASNPFRGVQARQAAAACDSTTDTSSFMKKFEFGQPGMFIHNLKAGEKMNSYNTNRPNVNFGAFVASITASLSASLGIPVEVLNMSFNANYSASRASLLLFWNVVECWRDFWAVHFLDPIYEAWMTEEVAAQRIPVSDWNVPVFRRAWLNCSWIGINKPSIDPLKEASAAVVRIESGLTTRDREAKAYNGSEFSENMDRLRVENAELAAANAPLNDGARYDVGGRLYNEDGDEIEEDA